MKRLVALALIPAVLVGCSTPPVINPVLHGPAQTASYEQGRPIITEAEPTSVAVATVINPDADDKVAFWVGVTNRTKSTLEFGIEDVSAESEEKPVQVYTYPELARHEKVKLVWGTIGIIAGAAAGAAAASVPATVHTSGNVFTSGSGGAVFSTFHGNTTVYNPAASAAAAAIIGTQAGAGAAALKGGYRANMAALQEVLQRNTVAPGETRGGVVLVKDSGDIQKGYTVHIRFGGLTRNFTFQEVKR